MKCEWWGIIGFILGAGIMLAAYGCAQSIGINEDFL